MRKWLFGRYLLVSILITLTGSRANALPGQSTERVAAWIEGHPTLRPGLGAGLIVKKIDTPARRFTFEAREIPPGRIGFNANPGIIRSESISFYDAVSGVSFTRLAEALRTIYGLDIYQDFDRATVIYTYPTRETTELARRQNRPLLAAQKGELRLGSRYAYWVEIAETETGIAYNGEITVFLKEDLNKIETELRAR
ncbi:hypothetical protein [Oscillatoria salina]|uniref:hypothetical protein n=1 Tax=Oscillatoria salina TaxID=331517 RepID=UPI001CCAA593|nr:hypothetical protein [Oscillatoria salina]MBZ8179656.1 hypothetical protein [Oscillatoria salina IIICB1]